MPDVLCINDIERLSQMASFKLERKEIIKIYTYSKSTVILDCDVQQRLAYSRMHFGEFLDMVCRLVVNMFQNSELFYIPYIEKLKSAFQNMFELVDEEIKIPQVTIQNPFPQDEIDFAALDSD